MMSDRLIGALWMVVTTLCFSITLTVVRYIGTDMPATQAAFIRYLSGAVMLAPFWLPVMRRLLLDNKNQTAKELSVKRKSLGFFILRGSLHSVAVILWFYATIHIPIAEVTAIGYSIPLYVTIGAALFFGEHLKPYHLFALAIGFIGAIIIIRPGFQEVSLGQLAQLLASPIFAASYLMAKRLSFKESSMVIVGMLSLFVSMAQLPMALIVWTTPDLFDVISLALVAILATTGHYAMTQSFRLTPMTISQPVTYLQLVWATIMGIYLFGDRFDIFVILGGALITLSATVIAYLDTRVSQDTA
ncbi:MAG: DMT family transporter [Alphaproteobacteria bacterium]|nr:DMT family transporter [Alphaproteobacteria bacterium]